MRLVHCVSISILVIVSHACPVRSQCYGTDNLYPYGASVDEVLSPVDDGPATPINLRENYTYYGKIYNKIYINPNGPISFGDHLVDMMPSEYPRNGPPFLAAFWNDIDISNKGNIYYRQTNDTDLMERIQYDMSLWGNLDYNVSLAVIITWSKVPPFQQHLSNRKATFQVVLIMNNETTFAMFNYGRIGWYITNFGKSVAVLNKGDNSRTIRALWPSGSRNMLSVRTTCGNAGVFGRYVIWTDPDIVKIIDRPGFDTMNKCRPVTSALYQYGEIAGDNVTIPADDGPATMLTLPEPFIFYGTPYENIYINPNGPVSFKRPFVDYRPQRTANPGNAFVTPFWNDISFIGLEKGDIFYHVSNDTELLEQFQTDLLDGLFEMEPSWVTVITWHEVQYYNAQPDDPVNTFQVVLGTNGSHSYVMFNYGVMGWYQDPTLFVDAVATINRGDSTPNRVSLTPDGPEWFYMNMDGNTPYVSGRYIFDTSTRRSPSNKDDLCRCSIVRNGILTTYDGWRIAITGAGRYRMATILQEPDPCNFQLAIQTEEVDNITIISDISLSFGVNEANSSKFANSILISENGEVLIAGDGFYPAVPVIPPYNMSTWDNLTHVSIVGNISVGWTVISTTCPYSVRYIPLCPSRVLKLTFRRSRYYNDTMYYNGTMPPLRGLCQDCDRDPLNDMTSCQRENSTEPWIGSTVWPLFGTTQEPLLNSTEIPQFNLTQEQLLDSCRITDNIDCLLDPVEADCS